MPTPLMPASASKEMRKVATGNLHKAYCFSGQPNQAWIPISAATWVAQGLLSNPCRDEKFRVPKVTPKPGAKGEPLHLPVCTPSSRPSSISHPTTQKMLKTLLCAQSPPSFGLAPPPHCFLDPSPSRLPRVQCPSSKGQSYSMRDPTMPMSGS
jgi:hypothetical protein